MTRPNCINTSQHYHNHFSQSPQDLLQFLYLSTQSLQRPQDLLQLRMITALFVSHLPIAAQISHIGTVSLHRPLVPVPPLVPPPLPPPVPPPVPPPPPPPLLPPSFIVFLIHWT